MTNQQLAERLTYPLLVNQVCRVVGDTVVIDVHRGSKILGSQRKVAEIKLPKSEAESILAQGQTMWYRHVQGLDGDLGISYSRFD